MGKFSRFGTCKSDLSLSISFTFDPFQAVVIVLCIPCEALWLLAAGLFRILSSSLCYWLCLVDYV